MRFFGSLRGVYDTGLTAYNTVDPLNPVATDALAGLEVRGGVYGTKSWRHTDLSLNYIGGYRAYNRGEGFNGTDQSIMVGVSHDLNARTFFQTTNVGATMSRAFGLGYGFITPGQSTDPSTLPISQNELYDSRFYVLSNMNTLGYKLSPRTSISANGGAYIMRRSDNLIGSVGIQAAGDIAYRLTRRQTVSAAYQFYQFNFNKQYGNSAVNQVSLTYAIQLSRWTLAGMVGGARMESEGVEIVQIPPEIAAIIGQSTGTQAFHQLKYAPLARVSINSRFRSSTVGISAGRSVTPGNGIVLTGVASGVTTYYSYTGLRKWTFNISAGYSKATNQIRYNASTEFMNASSSIGYQIRSDIQANCSAAYRDQHSRGTSEFVNVGWRLTCGFSYSPGEIPLALW